MSISRDIRLPLVWLEASVRARESGQMQRGLLIGPATSTADGQPYLITSAAQAAARWGRGSILAKMARVALANYGGELWGLGLSDPVAGSAASWSSTITGPSTAAGTIRLWVGSTRYSLGVPAEATASAVAAAIVSAVNADADAEVVASSDGGVVTLASKHKGIIGGSLRVAWDEDTVAPAGLTLGPWSATAGTGDHDFPSLPEVRFSKIAVADAAMLSTLGDELDARWAVEKMLWGWGVLCTRADADTLITTAQAAEYQWRHVSLCHVEPGCRSSPWEVAAAVCGAALESDSADPGLTVSGLALSGVPGPYTRTLTGSQADLLIRYGVTPVTSDKGQDLEIVRAVTTRWSDGNGQRDERSYQAPQMWALEYFLSGLLGDLRATFARRRLASDGPYVPPGAATPKIVRDYLVSRVQRYVRAGVLEWDPDLIRLITVARAEDDSARLDVYLPVDLVDGLEILAATVAY